MAGERRDGESSWGKKKKRSEEVKEKGRGGQRRQNGDGTEGGKESTPRRRVRGSREGGKRGAAAVPGPPTTPSKALTLPREGTSLLHSPGDPPFRAVL